MQSISASAIGEGSDINVSSRDDSFNLEGWEALNAKTAQAALPVIQQEGECSAAPIEPHRVTLGPVAAQEEPIDVESGVLSLMENMTPEMYQALQTELDQAEQLAETEPELNFIYQLRAIIAKAYEQQGRLSDKDRLQLDNAKEDFKKAMDKQSSLFSKMGTAGLWIAIGCTALFFGSFLTGKLQSAIQYLSNQDKTIQQIVQNKMTADIKMEEGKSTLSQNKISQVQNKTQSEGNQKQEYSRILEAALDAARSAARAQ